MEKEVLGVKARRVESPSSINTYNQCPRRYFHNYIQRLKSKGNIHTIKGNVVHSVLETFFEEPLPENLDYNNVEEWISEKTFKLFVRFWKEKKEIVKRLEISEGMEAIGINDCVNILNQWTISFMKRMQKTNLPCKEAFNALKPKHKEKYFKSEKFSVHGFVDVIEEVDGRIRLMDYKTSSSSYVGDEYFLQLGVYALLYEENLSVQPQEVGIYFLRDENGERVLTVNDNMLENAKRQIVKHHGRTQSDDMKEYPKKPGFQCKWATGQCDFYKLCFGGR